MMPSSGPVIGVGNAQPLSEEARICNDVVSHLHATGVNFLAIDFDDTLIQGHTFGRWPGNAVDLAAKIRPLFRSLIPVAMLNGLHVAIVTFSSQVSLIRQCLLHQFPDFGDNILIRGMDDTWEYHGDGDSEGKQKHLASVAEEINNNDLENMRNGVSTNSNRNIFSSSSSSVVVVAQKDSSAVSNASKITRATTLLIDDDINNVFAALRNKVRAILCSPQYDNPERQLIDDLLRIE